jgi:dUTP pyrophosphatase
MRIVLDEGCFLPLRAHSGDAGLDLRTPRDVYIESKGSAIIDTGVHIELPPMTVGEIKSKSGLNFKHGLTVPTGTVDYGYTGSIKVKIYNHSNQPYTFKRGDKIAQLVICPILLPELEVVDKLDDSDRGDNGFGSTGR